SDRAAVDFDRRSYDPLVGFGRPETRKAGSAATALVDALAALKNGNLDDATSILQTWMDDESEEDDDDDAGPYETEDDDNVIAHTTQAGAAVPLSRIQAAYDEIRALPPTAGSNKALALLEPLLASTPGEREERGNPKPESSTSGIEIDSDEGLALQKRMRAL